MNRVKILRWWADRGLSGSNVPEDFDYLAVFECEDMDWAEKKVHEQFVRFRHMSSRGRLTEFFWSGCIRDAIKYAGDLKGVVNITDKETEEIEVDENGEKQRKRVPNTTFEMIGLKKGTKIFFQNNPDKVAITMDGKNKIEYDGKISSISNIAEEILGYHVNGFGVFYFDKKPLFNMHPDMK